MSVRRLQTLDALSVLSHELSCVEDGDVDIDFAAVGLYLVGLQVVCTVVACATGSVLACWLLPPHAISAVRTLAIVLIIAVHGVMKPLRVGRPRGVASIFNVLRPSVAIYVGSLVLEQLVHTCVQLPEDAVEGGLVRRSVLHGTTLLLLVAGMIRARRPRAESDLPFLIAAFALLILAIVPPAAVSHTGPLCEPATAFGAGERLLRGALFATVYAVLAYSAAPRRCVSNDVFVCATRAAGGAVWVLACNAWLLFAVPVQVAIALCARLADDDDVHGRAGSNAEWLPLNSSGAVTPDRAGCGGSVDVEVGSDDADPSSGEALMPVTLKNGLRFELHNRQHACPILAYPPVGGGSRIVSGSGGAAARSCGGVTQQALAEVVARESAVA